MTWLQIVNLGMYLIISVAGVISICNNHRRLKWLYGLSATVLGLHGLAFYISYFVNVQQNLPISAVQFNDWSSALRLTGLIIIVVLLAAIDRRPWRDGHA